MTTPFHQKPLPERIRHIAESIREWNPHDLDHEKDGTADTLLELAEEWEAQRAHLTVLKHDLRRIANHNSATPQEMARRSLDEAENTNWLNVAKHQRDRQ